MELLNKLLLPNHALSRYSGFLVLYFGGQAPTDGPSLKAAIDIYDIEDVYNKCLGFATLRSDGVDKGSVILTQMTDRVALKGSPINYYVKYALTAVPTLQLGSPPDRIAVLEGTDPYAKVGKLNMAGMCRMHLMPWAGLDGMATNVPRCLGVSNELAQVGAGTMAMEWEWDVAREFGGILRSGSDTTLTPATHTLAVDAWVNGAWEQVLAPQYRNWSASAAIHHVFTRNVTTNKLRLRWSTPAGSYSNGCHGCIPLETKTSAPAPKAVPTIGWAVMLPLAANSLKSAWKLMERKDAPLPMLVAKVGGPGDGVGFDMILSKKEGLVSSDMPTVTGVKLNTNNAKE